LASCGVVVEQQQPLATVLPSGVQQSGIAEQMNVNASLQTPKLNAGVNCGPHTAVIAGELAMCYTTRLL